MICYFIGKILIKLMESQLILLILTMIIHLCYLIYYE